MDREQIDVGVMLHQLLVFAPGPRSQREMRLLHPPPISSGDPGADAAEQRSEMGWIYGQALLVGLQRALVVGQPGEANVSHLFPRRGTLAVVHLPQPGEDVMRVLPTLVRLFSEPQGDQVINHLGMRQVIFELLTDS